MRFGSARIVVILVLIGGGILLLATGFSGNAGTFLKAGASGTHTPSHSPPGPTHHSPNPTPAPQTTGVPIAVFNATTAPGAAGQAQERLRKDGYVPVQAAQDSPVKPFAKTVVYFRTGLQGSQNRSDAQYVADQYFAGASVLPLGDAFVNLAKSAEIVIVIGNNSTSTPATSSP